MRDFFLGVWDMAGHNEPAAVSEELVREHAEGWAGFTRFLTIGIAAVLVILLGFVLQFATGWAFAVFAMIVGFIIVGILALLGKL